jgi:DNA-binding MarR family transcriptional regulator
MRDGYLRGALSSSATPAQMKALSAYVAAGGSVSEAARRVGSRPSTVKRHLADLRARSGLTTEQLIYVGRATGWLVVPSLDS